MPISLTHSSRYRTLDFSSDRPGNDLDCGISQSSEKAEEVTSKLHRILRPFLLRRCVCVCARLHVVDGPLMLTRCMIRLKADVEKGLPPKTEINMYIPMTRCAALLLGCRPPRFPGQRPRTGLLWLGSMLREPISNI